jgi:rod shape-determining protein MreC
MAARNFHLSNASLLTSFFIFALALQLIPHEVTSGVNNLFLDIFNPLLKIGRNVQMDAIRLRPGQEEAVSRADYERLWKVYKNLHAQILQLHQEYELLAKIRSGLPRFFSGLVLAHVTGAPSSFVHEIIINKGSEAFVQPGQYVLSPQQNSVIGIVRETSEQMARVRLLTDANQSIEVRIRRDGSEKDIGGLMFGTGKTLCKISMIEREQDIKIGDTVYAAPSAGKLDIPIVIGEIVEVRPDDLHPLLWDITVQPVEDMSRLDSVAVIVTDLSPLNPKEKR